MSDTVRAGAAYGLDSPNQDDLTPVVRGRNQAVLLTGFWDLTKNLGIGVEASRWWTSYVGANTATSWRGGCGRIFGLWRPLNGSP